ncbi:MAG: transporter, partial [Bacteroidaceae bacterium]|nr:transporter [Bacteroidaceae bacterium]
MKKALLALAIFSTSHLAWAGGLLTNTNQSAAFVRNPSRDAVIDIDGVYSNPAGVNFMSKGFHIGLSLQSAKQSRDITTT